MASRRREGAGGLSVPLPGLRNPILRQLKVTSKRVALALDKHALPEDLNSGGQIVLVMGF